MAQGKRFKPTVEQLEIVQKLASRGMLHEDIAAIVGVSKKTLYKYFKNELDRGGADKRLVIRETLFQMATMERIPAAAIFLAKTECGMREKDPVKADEKPTTIILQRGETRKSQQVISSEEPEAIKK